MVGCSLVPRPRAPPGEKRSGERSRISWAYYPKRVITNEIARSVIITLHSLTTVKFVHLHSSIRTFFERVGRKMFCSLLGYIVAKVCASPRNSTWFTRPFLLVRGWGLGTRLGWVVPHSLCSCIVRHFRVCKGGGVVTYLWLQNSYLVRSHENPQHVAFPHTQDTLQSY